MKRVAVLKGGPSKEREVSLRTGAAVAEALRVRGYEVTEVIVDGPDFLLPDGCEFVFLSLHGTFGEDGQIQRILDARGIGYTGCGSEVSACAFDKERSKAKFLAAKIPTPRGEVLHSGEPTTLQPPLVFKPSKEGSSIGVELVFEASEVIPALERSRKFGDVILAEEMIQGRELTVGILEGKALPVVEIRPKAGYYDYQNKYTAGMTEYLCPAPLDAKTAESVQLVSEQAHRALGCEVYSRVDVLLDAEEKPWVLEVNTIPGMTATSLLPKGAQAAGIDFPELCERILKASQKIRGGRS